MRILITGGFGFVGGRLAAYLAQAGHQIVLGSRRAGPPPTWLPQAEVAQIEWDDGRALEHSCTGVDVVIQAAGMNAQDCATDPVAALAFNGVSTARLVVAASRAGVRRFIYLSTAHVYASPLEGTITEETCPRNLHPYATSHLAGEHALLQAAQCSEMEGAVLRLSNAFGAPMHKDANCWMLLVNDLCRQAVETHRMVLHSSGLQYRDFVAMAEVCRVIGWLVGIGGTAQDVAIYNVGSGVSQSVLEMTQLIQTRCEQVLGFEPELQRPEAAVGVYHESLYYRRVNLEKTGFEDSECLNTEIDRLLLFCHAQFRRINGQ